MRRAQVTSRLAGESRLISAVAFSGDGRKVITAGADSPTRVWDAATGAPVATLSAGPVEVVALNADGQRALTTSANKAVIWDIGQQRAVSTLPGHAKTIALASFTPTASQRSRRPSTARSVSGMSRPAAPGRSFTPQNHDCLRLDSAGSSIPSSHSPASRPADHHRTGDRLFALGEESVVRSGTLRQERWFRCSAVTRVK